MIRRPSPRCPSRRRRASAGLIAAGALAALAGCATQNHAPGLHTANAQLHRAFQEEPFVEGPVQVLAERHGRMVGYKLFPCHSNTRICGASPSGRAGHLTRTAAYDIVSGAYRGVTFYLSPGGDGYLKRGDHWQLIAWDDIDPIVSYRDLSDSRK